MTGPACLVFDDDLTSYDFGPAHPMSPVRVDLTVRLARATGVLDLPDLSVVPAPTASDDDLARVHTTEYIDAVRRISASPQTRDLAHGLGTEDNPTFAGMHQASAHIVGATLEAARHVWEGTALHAANITGGLHHAMAASASGFCIYNDPAIAIRWLLDQGASKVAYVDVDVHHGDGVQDAFYDDPRVLTISLHETPRTLFPGTGEASESGGRGAEGMSVNVALPPGTGDGGWLRAFHAVVPPLLAEFAPDVLVTQHGCDSHMDDPLAHLMLSVDGQRAASLALHELAHEVCGGRWVATGGGGYAIVEVVPRTWTHLLAVIGGSPLDPATPVPWDWRQHVASVTGRVAPSTMSDGRDPVYTPWSSGYNPDSWLDRCVEQCRREVFPWHGLDLSY
ncbi:MAG: acetoin utilization protein AcuC [Nocardioidaceae bacterium]|jgi:acetoin utilization protein AcuC|nr:acetoin utilization protein AcuC [Nocardioidaceae bacterium]